MSYFTTNSQVEAHFFDWVLLLQQASGLKMKVTQLEKNSGICDKEDATSCDQVPRLPACNV